MPFIFSRSDICMHLTIPCGRFTGVQFVISECKRVGEFALKVKRLHKSVIYDIKKGSVTFQQPLLTDVVVQGDVKIEFFKHNKLKKVSVYFLKVVNDRMYPYNGRFASARKNFFTSGSTRFSHAKFFVQIHRRNTLTNNENLSYQKIRAERTRTLMCLQDVTRIITNRGKFMYLNFW